MGVAAWALLISIISIVMSGVAIFEARRLANKRQAFELDQQQKDRLRASNERLRTAIATVKRAAENVDDDQSIEQAELAASEMEAENKAPDGCLSAYPQSVTQVANVQFALSGLKSDRRSIDSSQALEEEYATPDRPADLARIRRDSTKLGQSIETLKKACDDLDAFAARVRAAGRW